MVYFLHTLIIYPLIQVIEFAFMLFNSVFKNEGISVIGVNFAVSILCLPLYIVAERWQQIQRDTEKKLDPGNYSWIPDMSIYAPYRKENPHDSAGRKKHPMSC